MYVNDQAIKRNIITSNLKDQRVSQPMFCGSHSTAKALLSTLKKVCHVAIADMKKTNSSLTLTSVGHQ